MEYQISKNHFITRVLQKERINRETKSGESNQIYLHLILDWSGQR